MARLIELTQGLVTVVDDCDYERLAVFNWCADRRGDAFYAIRAQRTPSGKWSKIYMHRVILAAPEGSEVDHMDLDGLNNVRSNLRLASRAENNRNQRMPRSNSSGLKGASWDCRHGRWQAKITVNRVQIHLGRFDTKEEAHAAYVAASAKLHGAFGRTR